MAKEKFNYLNCFIELTKKAIDEADILVEILKNYNGSENMFEQMQEAHEIEHAGDDINHQIFRQVAKDFITPIDREDLLLLASNLDNVLDSIEVAIQHIYMYDVHNILPESIEFAKLVKQSCVALKDCCEALKHYKKDRSKVSDKIVKVNEIEETADILYMDVIRRLYTEDKNKPVKIMVWSRIYHNMEECCDACEHATDVILSVLLKNS